MTLQELQLKHALEYAKEVILNLEGELKRFQPAQMNDSTLTAIAKIDTEIYKMDDKIEMEHSHLLTVTDNS